MEFHTYRWYFHHSLKKTYDNPINETRKPLRDFIYATREIDNT